MREPRGSRPRDLMCDLRSSSDRLLGSAGDAMVGSDGGG